jgi:hypothetical protein
MQEHIGIRNGHIDYFCHSSKISLGGKKNNILRKKLILRGNFASQIHLLLEPNTILFQQTVNGFGGKTPTCIKHPHHA